MANKHGAAFSYSRRIPTDDARKKLLHQGNNYCMSDRRDRTVAFQNHSREDSGNSYYRSYQDNKRRHLDGVRRRKNSYDSGSPSSEQDFPDRKVNGKLRVTNLAPNVSNADIKELFEDYGTLVKADVHYGNSGRTLGTAYVVFEEKTDAAKAMEDNHNRCIDGVPMKIDKELDEYLKIREVKQVL
jgi:RNA recognition motif-containing protein